MVCSSCGSPVPSGARFCSDCGAPLAKSEEERRVVTVLFADIVGFTGLAEHLDPEDVKRRVDTVFDRLSADITSFGGVVDKILGDGIVALFGAPVAHEDDAERAVRAGLRMQQTVAATSSASPSRFQLRIGVNTGEVLVGSSAAGGDYTAMGDVVNSAARLQGLAQPGRVLVGAATQAATREAISYQDLGELVARGREGGLAAWSALGAVRPPGARTRRIADFVGREHELGLLHAQARMAVELNQAQTTTIFGEAGAGKTRLVEEAAGQLASRFGARVLEGRCVPYGEANVWWPIADVLRHAVGLTHDSPEAEVAAAIDELVRGHLGAEPDEQLARHRTALLHALGFETPLRGGDRGSNRAEVTLAVTRLFEVELSYRPVVLVISDIHWAAEAVWGLLRHLVSELSRSQLIVLVTARRSEIEERLEGRFGTLSLELGPLGAEASTALVADLGVSLPDYQVAELVERSGGNPFFLEELAGLVSADGEHRSASPVLGIDRARLDRIPDNLRGILAARLDRLGPSARSLLEGAAVLGRSGSVEGLAINAAASGRNEEIGADLAVLEEADLLSVSGNRYEFMSDLIREVAYGTITKTTRAQNHAGIAGYLEDMSEEPVRNSLAVAIARHYAAAAELLGDVSDVAGLDPAYIVSKALTWLEEAGWRALGAGVPKEAEQWFATGLELSAGDDPVQAAFLFGRAKARCEIRDFAGTRADLDRLEPLARHDAVLTARALVISGDIDQKAGDTDRAAAQLREAADRLDALEERPDQALALRLLGMTEMLRGNDTMTSRALTASRSVAADAGDRREEAWAIQALAWFAYRSGRLHDAKEFVAEAEAIFTELDDRGGLAWTRGVEAWVAFHVGDWARARELLDEVMPETRRRGDPFAEAIMLTLVTSMALWSGESKRAITLAQESQAIAERADDFALAVQARALEGRALISRARVSEGVAALEQSFALSDRHGDDESRRIAVISNCAASARLGDPDRVIRWAARFDGTHDDPTVVGESDLSVSLALAMLQRGAVAEADSQISWIESFDDDPVNTNGVAVGALVAAAAGDVELAKTKATSVATSRSTYLDRTMARMTMAALANGAGLSDQVDQHVAEARGILAATDDRLTPLVVSLAEAVWGQGSLSAAEADLRAVSVDPKGWATAWRLAGRTHSVSGAASADSEDGR